MSRLNSSFVVGLLGMLVASGLLLSACNKEYDAVKGAPIYSAERDGTYMGCKDCAFSAKNASKGAKRANKKEKKKRKTSNTSASRTVAKCIDCPAPYKTGGPQWCSTTNTKRYGPRRGPLTSQERKMAKVAWKYFENNFNPETGLVNAVNAYPSTTLWDTGSYLAGMVAARELGIIDKDEMDQRMQPLIRTFNTMDLFRDEMPNKAYNTKTGQKVNYANKPGEIGFSALDIGRLLIWFSIIKNRYPEYSNSLDRVMLRWNWCNVVDAEGTMFGAIVDKDSKETRYLQEGRLGYEEYAAKGFQLWGFDTTKASLPEPYSRLELYGSQVAYDTRDPRRLKAHNYVVNESYVLDHIELGWDQANDSDSAEDYYTDPITAEFGHQVYAAQQGRYCDTGILTARTEHQLDKAPYFVYDTIYTDGYAWNTITESGEHVPQFSAVALKGALGMWAVWDSPYTDMLFDYISGLYDPEKGFYEGVYENGSGLIKTWTANNNGIMLESLLFKVQGKLLTPKQGRGPWDKALEDPFSGKKQCLPHFRCGAGTCASKTAGFCSTNLCSN